MNEENVTIEHDGLTLEGSLAVPATGQADKLVLLIAGSGPLDRNQNTAKFQLNLFNGIAESLADSNIASIRYDKRGCGNSQGDYDSTGHDDLVRDARAWLHYAQGLEAFSSTPLYLLGHSEGAIIAPQVAKSEPSIAGQILLCPFLENFESLIERQARNSLDEIARMPGFKGKIMRLFLRLGGDQIAKQKKLIKRIRHSAKPTLTIKKQVINAKWIREMIELDTEAIYSAVQVPTLAIGGQKDVQCLPEDVEKLKSVYQGPLESHVLPDLTHILRSDPDEASTQHYTALTMEKLDARLLDIIAQWLKAH